MKLISNIKAAQIQKLSMPIENASIPLSFSKGCTWNKCTFCSNCNDTSFQKLDPETVVESTLPYYNVAKEIVEKTSDNPKKIKRELNRVPSGHLKGVRIFCDWINDGSEYVFIQDKDMFAYSTDEILSIIEKIKMTYPSVKYIEAYTRVDSILSVSEEDLQKLKVAGLEHLHIGFESGSDFVLKKIKKGFTKQNAIDAGKKLNDVGITFSAYIMLGIGGQELSYEHCEETVALLDEISPEYIRIRSTILKENTELYDEYVASEFSQSTEDEKLMELAFIIENCKAYETELRSNHLVNLLAAVNGRLGENSEKMLKIIDEYLELTEDEKRMYQLARRDGLVNGISDLQTIRNEKWNHIRASVRYMGDEWEDRIFSKTQKLI